MAPVSPEQVTMLGHEPDFDELMALFESDGSVDLDKMWDAVRSLFGDDLDPIFDGDPITEDLGYGPATFVSVERAGDIAAGLSNIQPSALSQSFSREALAERRAYPDIWDRPDEMTEVRREVVDLAMSVVQLYQLAAATGRGIIIAML